MQNWYLAIHQYPENPAHGAAAVASNSAFSAVTFTATAFRSYGSTQSTQYAPPVVEGTLGHGQHSSEPDATSPMSRYRGAESRGTPSQGPHAGPVTSSSNPPRRATRSWARYFSRTEIAARAANRRP